MDHSTRLSLLVDEALEQGQTRLVCPECGGGSSKERSMSVWEANDGTIMATCYRANCGFGTRPVRGSGHAFPAHQWKEHGTKQSELSTYLTEEDMAEFNDQQEFQYSRRALSLHVMRSAKGWVFPMLSRQGDLGGVVVRPFRGESKALTYRYRSDWDGVGWYVCTAKTPACDCLYVVEDARSAMALWDVGTGAVTLNGTNLNSDRYDSFQRTGKRVILALDADATEKAIAYRMRYGTGLVVRRLSRDVKNMSRQEVAMLVQS